MQIKKGRHDRVRFRLKTGKVTGAEKVETTHVLSTNEQLNKMCCIHTMEYYSFIKGNGIWIHATTWINPENIILSDISQALKDKYRMSPLI